MLKPQGLFNSKQFVKIFSIKKIISEFLFFPITNSNLLSQLIWLFFQPARIQAYLVAYSIHFSLSQDMK